MIQVQKCFKNKDSLEFILIEKDTTIEEINSWCRKINPTVVYTSDVDALARKSIFVSISVGTYIVKITENKLQSFTKEEFEKEFSTVAKTPKEDTIEFIYYKFVFTGEVVPAVKLTKNNICRVADTWGKKILIRDNKTFIELDDGIASIGEWLIIWDNGCVVNFQETTFQRYFRQIPTVKEEKRKPVYNYYIQAVNSLETFTNKVTPKYTVYQNKLTKKLVTTIQITTENLELLALQYGRLSISNQYLIMITIDGKWSAFVGDWIIQHDDYVDSVDDKHFHLNYEKPREEPVYFNSIAENLIIEEKLDDDNKINSCEFDTLDFKSIKPRFRNHNEDGFSACQITASNYKLLAKYCEDLFIDTNFISNENTFMIILNKKYLCSQDWVVFYIDSTIKSNINAVGYGEDDFKKNYKLTK